MMQSNPFGMSAGLLFNFIEDKCLKQLTEELPLIFEFSSIAAKEIASQAEYRQNVVLGSL